MKNSEKRGHWLLWLGLAVLVAAMLLQFAVNCNITVYSGDYKYATFFRNGLSGFVRNTIDHYKSTNGRWFVHILIPIVLLADTKLFAFLSPLFTAGIFLLGLRMLNRDMRKAPWLLAAGLGLLSLLGSEVQYLRMSLYWIAAYFNYAFPLIFPLGVVAAMDRGRPFSPWAFAGISVCAFFAGAGTEQCGLISLILIWGFWLLRLRGNREDLNDASPSPESAVPSKARRNPWLLLPLLTSAGYLTILLAPGSRARVSRGIDGGIFSVLDPEVFLSRFFDVMHYLCGFWFWNLLFTGLCLIVGLLCLTSRDLPRHLLSGLPAGILAVTLAVAGWEPALAVFTVLYTLYLAVTFLFFPRYQATGLLLLGAGASVMMLTITTLYYARTFFPCLILCLIAAWSLLFRLLDQCPLVPGAVACCLLAAVCVARYVPIYQGYAKNHQVVVRNLQAVEESRSTGELTLCIDMDPDYRFNMFYEGSYFLTHFLKYYRLPSDIHITFTSEEWKVSKVHINGQESTFPSLEKDGKLLLPIEFVFQSAGGTCVYDWSNSTYDITWQNAAYILYENGKLMEYSNGCGYLKDEDCQYVRPFSETYTLLYLSEEDFARCFGITFDYDPAENVYLLAGTQ